MKLLFTIVLVSFSFWTYSQCSVSITTQSDTVDCGGCFDLTAVGIAQDTLLFEDFNNSALGPGWTSSQTMMYTNPCGAPPDGSPSAWFGNQQPHPRDLTTVDYDMTCGGDICFMMKYATQGGSGSCEGPDLVGEGVSLQYSINAGVTWVTIFEHTVQNNGTDPYQTSWNEYCHTIPVAAQTTSTRFRWIQLATSGAGNDHWGIDDVAVKGNLCNTYYYDWFADGTTDLADTNLCIESNMETYNVIFTDGLTDTCTASIDMYGVILSNIPQDTSICGFVNIDLVSTPTGGSGNYSYLWNTGETSNTITNATTNLYTVFIQDQTYPSCTVTDTINFEMYPNPEVDFSASPLCQGSLTNFTDLTNLPAGYNVNQWQWNFDNNGATSTDENPSHQFSGVGTYDVKLNVVSDGGCVGDTTITIYIEPAPYADFTFTDGCAGEEVVFTNTSLGNFSNSTWYFTNGTIGSDTIFSTDATFIFPEGGSFDVTLIIEDASGECTNSITQTININPAPDVSFTANPPAGVPVLNVNFLNDPSNLTSNYWDFGDGNNTSAMNDTIFNAFTEPGVYTVTHTGTDAVGCTNTFSVTVTVTYPDIEVTIPNIVTPNGDGMNDGFFIKYSQDISSVVDFEIVFLNRWGTVIQTFNEPNFVWNGKKESGEPLSDGTYFYKVQFKDKKDTEYVEHGFVQVVNN
ncbi:PKD domain-containing protein [Brumimicrobium mesophilum]|uniref:PKD domain-containing protein n=1 Tax=Brumimicrobium mesophilum TaxID=392717 RepID=UPI000D1400C2|nr:PKD domain-containing protein [Brumimicrobium mesophilum]